MMIELKNYIGFLILLLLFVAILPTHALGTEIITSEDFFEELLPPPTFDDFFGEESSPFLEVTLGEETVIASSTIQAIFLFTLIGLAPALLMMLTSFTRIIIILHFVRSALGAQQMPPNQVLIGLALFLTFFVMGPVFANIHENAVIPYMASEITQQEAVDFAMAPIRTFMLSNMPDGTNIRLFADIAGYEYFETYDDIPLRVLIPAFILTEITIGFIFGFLIYIPFIVVDMVVASVLMAMGMMMLPPVMISLPFKLLLFLLVDGWGLVVRILIQTFQFIP